MKQQDFTKRHVALIVAITLTLFIKPLMAQDTVDHQLMVQLIPDSGQLIVTDTLTLPEVILASGKLSFTLHGELEIKESEWAISRTEKLADSETGAGVPVTRYSFDIPENSRGFSLSYQGVIKHKVDAPDKNHSGGLTASSGIIDKQGVFLAASSQWFPQVHDAMVTFQLTVAVPRKWDAISQGKRVRHKKKRSHTLVEWRETRPQDDIYLIAGKYKEYLHQEEKITAMVMMRSEEDQLARAYLDATIKYIDMYEKMLGPYPYDKFALVENFWETGYGMPSFTLLGPRVMRFPFIIYSSYPHEILHNWWGNGVFVDYQSGNWAEGLTNYLADHLIKENRHKGLDHRRDTLQKYTDFVGANKDFPLTKFVSRHDAVTEAVGYGKTMMLFHMLRRTMGDEKFILALRKFYKRYAFKVASFDDIAKVFSEFNKDTKLMFKQWVENAGAPTLQLKRPLAMANGNTYTLQFTLSQSQDDNVFRLAVPLAVGLEGQAQAWQSDVLLDVKEKTFELQLPARPVTLAIDPEFDIFRRLHLEEIPAALSQGFGAESVTMVLPAAEDEAVLAGYKKLVEQWRATQNMNVTVVLDSELQDLPKDSSVWLLGWKNKHLGEMAKAAAASQLSAESLVLEQKKFSADLHSAVLTVRHPQAQQHTLLWVAANSAAAIPGLARKLPHYRKYSYLVFTGSAPDNIVKGQWPVRVSPLMASVRQLDGKKVETSALNLKERKSLAEVPALRPVGGRH